MARPILWSIRPWMLFMNKVESAILKTLIYSNLFDCPMKAEDLHKFLISGAAVSLPELNNNLKFLEETGQIEFDNGFYCLPSRCQLVQERRKREAVSAQKIKRLNFWVKVFSLLPWVKMVGITGALSYYDSGPFDDIDLMIVTSKSRMWLSRLIVFLFLKLLGRKRGESQSKTGNKICVNVWGDEDNLSVPLPERDLVVAHDVAHLIPLVNKNGTYQKFIQDNLWTKIFLPNWNC